MGQWRDVGGAGQWREGLYVLRAGLVCCEVLCACCCVLCLLLQIVEAGDSLGITPEAVTGLYKSERLLNVPHPPGAKCPSPPPPGAARVVCLMEHPQVTAGISSLCQKIATPLQAFASPGEHEGDPSLWMDRLAAVFRCVCVCGWVRWECVCVWVGEVGVCVCVGGWVWVWVCGGEVGWWCC